MSILKPARCPACGASLTIEEGVSSVRCDYCGQTFALGDNAPAHTSPPAPAKAPRNGLAHKPAGCLIVAAALVLICVVSALFSAFGAISREMAHSAEYDTADAPAELVYADPFEDVTVTFSGISGSAWVNVENNAHDSTLRWLDITASPRNDLSIGDTVTLTVNDAEEDLLQDGYLLTAREKEYTVPPLDRYIDDLALLPEDVLDALHTQSYLKLTGQSGDVGDPIRQTEDWTNTGMYLLVSKTGKGNYLYDVFRSSYSNGAETVTVYNACRYGNIVLKEDGSIQCDYQASPQWNMIWLFDSLRYVNGFDNPQDFYNTVIRSTEGDYTHSETDGVLG